MPLVIDNLTIQKISNNKTRIRRGNEKLLVCYSAAGMDAMVLAEALVEMLDPPVKEVPVTAKKRATKKKRGPGRPKKVG